VEHNDPNISFYELKSKITETEMIRNKLSAFCQHEQCTESCSLRASLSFDPTGTKSENVCVKSIRCTTSF